jgi:hypothetical protein
LYIKTFVHEIDGKAWIPDEFSDDGGLSTIQTVVLPDMEYFGKRNIDEAVKWLYPSGFNPELACNQTILAVTNETVDEWNTTIQALNPNPTHILKSHDVFADVDDPKGILQKNLTPIILNEFNNPGTVPPHELHLKVRYYIYKIFYVRKFL